ncbi:protein diaphanous homolog 1 [Egretta garzetta]|uniref:protein diaphanous homolog 1 n=1 Tax=Egretta garzetta TaxID=188379 RepID=UPI00163C15FC|nr:protein diaphanous homolog 1 [Egretta garzetta]
MEDLCTEQGQHFLFDPQKMTVDSFFIELSTFRNMFLQAVKEDQKQHGTHDMPCKAGEGGGREETPGVTAAERTTATHECRNTSVELCYQEHHLKCVAPPCLPTHLLQMPFPIAGGGGSTEREHLKSGAVVTETEICREPPRLALTASVPHRWPEEDAQDGEQPREAALKGLQWLTGPE